MPNHVKNIVKMQGITSIPFYNPNKYETGGGVDFNKLIPMPESLNIEDGSLEYLALDAINRKLNARMYSRMFKPGQVALFLSNDQYEERVKCSGKTEQQLIELGLQYITNVVKYNAPTWYDWCCDNWGTKWNAYCDDVIDDDTISFETAWSAPLPILLKLSETYPELVIEHRWADENVGYNTGHVFYQNGKISSGGFKTDDSAEAHATYIECWGTPECYYLDKAGKLRHRNCDRCDGCKESINKE